MNALSDASDLVVLRGALREGVAAIQNLGQLLHSPRVGARALALALPAGREGTEQLHQALSAVDQALSLSLAPGAELEAARSTLAFAAQRVGDLERMLEAVVESPATGAGLAGQARAQTRPPSARLRAGERARSSNPRVGARHRLKLEAEAASLLVELATVQVLVDLFSSADPSRTTVVDLGEVLAEIWSPPHLGPSVEVILNLGVDPTFVGDARQAAAVIELALAVVAEGASKAASALSQQQGSLGSREGAPAPCGGAARSPPLHLTATRIAGGRLVVHLRRHDPRATAGLIVRAVLRACVPPLLAALPVAARRAGFEVTLAADTAEATITLPAAAAPD